MLIFVVCVYFMLFRSSYHLARVSRIVFSIISSSFSQMLIFDSPPLHQSQFVAVIAVVPSELVLAAAAMEKSNTHGL